MKSFAKIFGAITIITLAVIGMYLGFMKIIVPWLLSMNDGSILVFGIFMSMMVGGIIFSGVCELTYKIFKCRNIVDNFTEKYLSE